jgi:hypothetical protein
MQSRQRNYWGFADGLSAGDLIKTLGLHDPSPSMLIYKIGRERNFGAEPPNKISSSRSERFSDLLAFAHVIPSTTTTTGNVRFLDSCPPAPVIY